MAFRVPLEAYCYAMSLHLLAVMELYGGIMPCLFNFQLLWSFIMAFMADLIGDFMKSIHVCAQLHYK